MSEDFDNFCAQIFIYLNEFLIGHFIKYDIMQHI